MNYILLIVSIACGILAFLCLLFCCALISFQIDREEQDELTERRKKIIIGIGIAFLITASISRGLWVHLSHTDPGVLELFGLWYLFGLVSRFLVLVKRQEVLSKQFSTDWDEVYAVPFWAFGGPLVTIHLVHILIWEKNWFKS